MSLSLILSAAAGLLTASVAVLWARFVAAGVEGERDADRAEPSGDIRTW